jgi:hypothetical protein
MICTKPPPGWRCTREDGHEGPCAAVEMFAALEPERPETIDEVKAAASEWIRANLLLRRPPSQIEEGVFGFIRRAFKAGFLADEQDRADAREQGRKEGIETGRLVGRLEGFAATVQVLADGTPFWGSNEIAEWFETDEGERAFLEALKKLKDRE